MDLPGASRSPGGDPAVGGGQHPAHDDLPLLGLILGALPLEMVTMGAWSGPPSFSPPPFPPSLQERRKKHPNLYAKWTDDDEAKLLELFRSGASFSELAKELGRTVGGVKARLVHLGELAPEEGSWPMRRSSAVASSS